MELLYNIPEKLLSASISLLYLPAFDHPSLILWGAIFMFSNNSTTDNFRSRTLLRKTHITNLFGAFALCLHFKPFSLHYSIRVTCFRNVKTFSRQTFKWKRRIKLLYLTLLWLECFSLVEVYELLSLASMAKDFYMLVSFGQPYLYLSAISELCKWGILQNFAALIRSIQRQPADGRT